jgi:hypothetical protein
MRPNRELGCVHEDRAGPSFQNGECYPLHGRTARQVAHITAKRIGEVPCALVFDGQGQQPSLVPPRFNV